MKYFTVYLGVGIGDRCQTLFAIFYYFFSPMKSSEKLWFSLNFKGNTVHYQESGKLLWFRFLNGMKFWLL